MNGQRGWLAREIERARERIKAVPQWARPVLTKQPTATRPTPPGGQS